MVLKQPAQVHKSHRFCLGCHDTCNWTCSHKLYVVVTIPQIPEWSNLYTIRRQLDEMLPMLAQVFPIHVIAPLLTISRGAHMDKFIKHHQTSRCVRGANIKHKQTTYVRIRDCRLEKTHTHKSDYHMLPTWPPASNRFNMINRHLLSICNQQVSEAYCQYLRMKLHLSCTRALSFKAPCPTIWHRMQAILYIVLWMHRWNRLKLHSFTIIEFEMFCCKTTAKLKHPEIPKLIHQSRPEPRTSRELLGVMVRTQKFPTLLKISNRTYPNIIFYLQKLDEKHVHLASSCWNQHGATSLAAWRPLATGN